MKLLLGIKLYYLLGTHFVLGTHYCLLSTCALIRVHVGSERLSQRAHNTLDGHPEVKEELHRFFPI